MSKKMLVMLLGAALFFGIVFGAKWFMNDQMAKGMATFTPPPTIVEATIATRETWTPTLSAIGTLTAKQGVDVRTEVSGVVRKVKFLSGESIKEGDVLAQLDNAIEKADLESYIARKKLISTTWERNKSLLATKSISQTRFDQSSAALEEVIASVAQTRASLNKKRIRAPFDGRIGIQQVEPGDYIDAGGIIATLQNINELYVNFAMPESEVPHLQIGQKIRFNVQAFPDKPFHGVVDAINSKIDSSTRNIEVRATMDNEDQLLLPGMFANVEVLSNSQKEVITLPREAVTYTLYGNSIFLINDKDPDKLTVELTQVQTGEIQGNRVEVVRGLNTGDRVVSSGQMKLHNGAPVTIKVTGE